MNSPDRNVGDSAQAPPGAASSSQRPPRLGLWALAALVVVIIATVAGLLPRLRQREALKAETRELAVPTVIVTSAVPGKATAGLALPAEVKALVEAPIYARANGYLSRWLVDIGARVEAGQLLAEIDTPEVRQELARSRAELNQAEAALGLSQISATRWAGLLKTASVSEQEVAEKQADLALKTATVEGARANVHRLEELLSFARVTAPFAGTITARKIDVGDLIAALNGKELFRLAQTGTLRVYTRVPQSAARGVAPGQTAEMTVPEIPGRVFAAKVVRTAGVMDAQSRTLLVELEVDNSQGEILAGSYAQVRFPELKVDAKLTVPSNTLLFRSEGPQVGVVLGDGRVELRNVKLGRDFGATLEILDGLSPADRIIVNPSDSLVSGAMVRISEPAKPAIAR